MDEELKSQFCDYYCKYPYIYDEEKEGIPLAESDICRNCPLRKLKVAKDE